MKALSKERCPLCNDKLKEGPNKEYHWKYKCKVVNIMKESGTFVETVYYTEWPK